ncbi:uncharacterized protein Tco025E_07260 [Trypanosoma conorhini]|uniref:Kelch repeat-containing protein n=1 Tax=Trypanosoma conorhini TaxID=83891 RepID=A0A422NR23_9TRYP|nr:uncharacterized protein Tco025E_07260 [Trypanosoma conorhini]RNF07960.1 hypothetical protein Tco025E_07260 [Trypanosoma conorhini]
MERRAPTSVRSRRDRGFYYEEPPAGMGGVIAEELDALEVRYHATFFRLHDGASNKLATAPPPQRGRETGATTALEPSSSQAAACEASGASESSRLHTPEELRQPLHQVPTPRSGHLLLSCAPRRSLILHGGLEVGAHSFLNDTWEYLIDAQRWVRLICHGAPARQPHRPRLGRESVSDEEQEVVEEMPPKAFGQSGSLFGDGCFLFVHGGVTDEDGDVAPAFQLDIARRRWSRLRLTTRLPTRWGSVAQTLLLPVPASLPSKRLSLTTSSFSSSSAAREAPASVEAQEGEEERRRAEVVVVFGGMHGTEAYNTTYLLYLTAPPPSSGKPRYCEGEKRVVEVLPPVASSVFPGRRRACATVCRGFFFFVFGGRDNNYFYNDLWVLNVYTRQWVMVREETPLRFMREFFLRPYDKKPGARIMEYIKNVLLMRRDSRRCRVPINIPHRCSHYNSSALWRTGAVMVARGLEIFILGGFSYDGRGMLATHKDVHVYNYMRHLWREACVDVGCLPSPFPAGYFAATREGGGSSPNWESVKNILSVLPDGRTMAAMCVDPVMPSFRFFLYGGRFEDEPIGELYDVRVHVTCAAMSDMSLVYERELQHCDDVVFRSAPAPWEARPLPLTSLACSPGEFPLAPRGSPRCCGERTLREQAGDWVRAVLLEEPTLRRTECLLLWPDDRVARQEWLNDAHTAGDRMQKKVDERLSEAIRSGVSFAPPFIRRG